MALSQKHAGKMLVPWFNSNEWKYVNNLMFATSSTDLEKLKALDIIKMWKIRTPRLPSGVEGTLIVLDVLLLKKDAVSEDKLKMLYGAAIMRFLNLCGAANDKQGTFYKTAKQNKLPDWLVDVRHNIAHDQIVPSMCMLHMGLDFCLNWLKENYWMKQNIIIKDFVIDFDPYDIKTVVELYNQINLAQYSGNLQLVQDLIELNPFLVEKLNALDVVEVDADTNVDTKYVLHLLLEDLYEQDYENLEEAITEAIITEGSLFAIQAEQCENGKEELPRGFIEIWQDLINMIYTKNKLCTFIKKLLNLCNDVETVEPIKKITSLWLAELCRSLLLAKSIYSQYDNLSNNKKLNKDTAGSVLKQLLQKENPELKVCLELDFQYCKGVLDNINSLRLHALRNPHIYTFNFLKLFLQVCGCSEEYIKESESSVNNYLVPQINSLVDLNQVHTLEEFQMQNIIQIIPMDSENIEDIAVPEVVPNNDAQPITTTMNGPQRRWRIVEDTSIFEGCPLGVLAYQMRENNPLLPQEVL